MYRYTLMHIYIPHTYTLHEPRPPAAAPGPGLPDRAWDWAENKKSPLHNRTGHSGRCTITGVAYLAEGVRSVGATAVLGQST